MKRIYNFSAGPSMLPYEVLEKAASELIVYGDSGMSVMEMSHRSADFEKIIEKTEADLRCLMNIPNNYKVLFLQGGASTQFSSVPLNLMKSGKADYILSGQFSTKAYNEGLKYGDCLVCASSKDKNFSEIPRTTRELFRIDADYVHICFNNTIYGTKFDYIPDVGNIPLVADMSSCILSEPVDITKFGVIYAGAQKNMAPAGLTVVIVRDDLLGWVNPITPSMLNWSLMADNDSAPVKKSCRSMMNVTFITGQDELDKKFAAEASSVGLKNLKGHRSVGGMRASIYNAMPYDGVEALVKFMEAFAADNPK